MMGSLIGGVVEAFTTKSDISRWDVNGIDYYSRDREINKAYCYFQPYPISSLSLTWSSFGGVLFWGQSRTSPKSKGNNFSSNHKLLFFSFCILWVYNMIRELALAGEVWRKENWMESEHMSNKNGMKVEIPQETEMVSPTSGLTRQPSSAKSNCLCSPTTHAGSFRCRLHRAPTLQRTKSIDSRDSASNSKADATSNANTVEAQWLFLLYYAMYIYQCARYLSLAASCCYTYVYPAPHLFVILLLYDVHSFYFNPVNILY